MIRAEALLESLAPEAVGRLRRFVDLLLSENQRMNLTSVREPGPAWALHVLDTLPLKLLVDELAPESILDIGSGGGAPGLPLACVCEPVQFTLLDATRKKVDALNRMIAALGLSNARAVWGRATPAAGGKPSIIQALSPDERPPQQRFDAIIARAVGPLESLVKLSGGLLNEDGHCWFHKSIEATPKEAREATKAARSNGLMLEGALEYELPAPHGQRVIVAYRRAPRSSGVK